MRYFLVVLAIVMASLGYTQSASAQACTGFALLKDGDQFVDMGGGRALVDNRCYERALCIGGTISNLGNNLYGCFVVPACEGTINLAADEVIKVTKSGHWTKVDDPRTYCSVKCPETTTLKRVAGETYACKPDAPVCSGVGKLKSGDRIWKKASNMWKTKDGKNVYCSVQCAAGTKLTNVNGDRHVCKPIEAANCKGELKRTPRRVEKAVNERGSFKVEDDSIVFYGARKCFTSKEFKAGSTVKCDNSTFTDPLFGVTKACFVRKK